MKLVHNLQNLALKHQNSITDLLRNAYTIAFKLNLPDFKQWILYELNGYNISDGIQQALNYAKMLEVPFAFSSNGDGFIFHNKLATEGNVEIFLPLNNFPTPEKL